MLKPAVQVHNQNRTLIAEFWDCLRLDPGPVQDLRLKYEAHLKAGGRAEVVIDLLGVDFAGSAALGHFVALHRVARKNNGRLIFCNVVPAVYDVFRVSRLDVLFTFAVDRAAALANVDDPAAGLAPPAEGAPPPLRGADSAGNGLLRSSRRRKLS